MSKTNGRRRERVHGRPGALLESRANAQTRIGAKKCADKRVTRARDVAQTQLQRVARGEETNVSVDAFSSSSRLERLAIELATRDADIADKETRIEDLLDELNTREGMCDAVTSELEEKDREIEALKSQLEDAEFRARSVQLELERFKKMVSDLQRSIGIFNECRDNREILRILSRVATIDVDELQDLLHNFIARYSERTCDSACPRDRGVVVPDNVPDVTDDRTGGSSSSNDPDYVPSATDDRDSGSSNGESDNAVVAASSGVVVRPPRKRAFVEASTASFDSDASMPAREFDLVSRDDGRKLSVMEKSEPFSTTAAVVDERIDNADDDDDDDDEEEDENYFTAHVEYIPYDTESSNVETDSE
ncbi:hypothetical protein KPH14_012615 [Odynerus spinipes]|uniref:Uncharacterized protein n=1 Tax=Odynerus spinipes TaxID=1348599 RepID=A0AAD9VL09_9HYME|nr:hypothetical protein KPH14_012615 [Odynerus spinipes]